MTAHETFLAMTEQSMGHWRLVQGIPPQYIDGFANIAPDGSNRNIYQCRLVWNRGLENTWIPPSKSERLTPKQIEWCKANIPAFEDLLK